MKNSETIFNLLYTTGTVDRRSSFCSCGPGLAFDGEGITNEDSYICVTEKATLADYEVYCEMLEAAGHIKTFSNEIEGNLFSRYAGTEQFYIYYIPSEETVRVIIDKTTNAPLPQKNGEFAPLEFYQYSIDYTTDGSNAEFAMNCGMMYILRFADGSLFIIDGAHKNQSHDAPLKGVFDFLKTLSCGEKIHIRAWYLTHAHGDHVYLTGRMIEKYHTEMEIDSFIFNFPSIEVNPKKYDIGSTAYFKEAARKYYPASGVIKIHTGEKFTIFGTVFEFLFTQEDLINAEGIFAAKDFNSTSAVLKITAGESSVMILADTSIDSSEKLLKMYTEKTLKSDIVQAAHHLINNLDELYGFISAKYVVAPASKENIALSDSGTKNLSGAMCATDFDHVCFAGDFTWKFVLADKISVLPLSRYESI